MKTLLGAYFLSNISAKHQQSRFIQ